MVLALATGGVALAGELVECAGVISTNAIGLIENVASIGIKTFRFFKITKESPEDLRLKELEDLMNKIIDYLGEGFTVLKPPGLRNSDLILTSADGTKQIRFDILYSHGKKPHVNVETFVPRNKYPGDDKMKKVTNEHAYPQGELLEESVLDNGKKFKSRSNLCII